MVFRNDSKNAADNNAAENNALVAAAVKTVSPVSELNAANRAAISKSASVVHVQRNDQLKPENSHRWLMYLVEGSLTLYAGKEEVGTIASNTTEAQQPLFQDKSAYQSARTGSVAKVARFGREQIDILIKEQRRSAVSVIDVHVGELDNLVFDDILEAMKNNKLTLGIAPESAIKILASFKKVSSIPELAEVIQLDAGLAAHVLTGANRVDGGSGSDSTSSIRGAITRLGVKEAQQLVSALLQSNPLKPGNKVIAAHLDRYQQRTALSATIAWQLAGKVAHLKQDVAVLVALTADIGELMVLSYANMHPDKFQTEQSLSSTVENLRGILSSWLVNSWDYPDIFVDAVHRSRDWYRNNTSDISYTDLVTAAFLAIQAEMPDATHGSMPSPKNLLLARQLQQSGIDLQASGDIVAEAMAKLTREVPVRKAS